MALQPKHVLAAVFLLGGAWPLLAPAHLIRTVMLRPEVTDATQLFVGCFGAQAVMCGTLFLTAEMTRAAYTAFAYGMIPFFIFFNYWFLVVKPMFNAWMWLDVGGSATILATCLWGLRLLAAEERSGAERSGFPQSASLTQLHCNI